jgi:superfamily II DNA/RNA helicase
MRRSLPAALTPSVRIGRVIVFAERKATANEVAEHPAMKRCEYAPRTHARTHARIRTTAHLARADTQGMCLHGDITQRSRDECMEMFKRGRISVLVRRARPPSVHCAALTHFG